jgi:hypothetical protein
VTILPGQAQLALPGRAWIAAQLLLRFRLWHGNRPLLASKAVTERLLPKALDASGQPLACAP